MNIIISLTIMICSFSSYASNNPVVQVEVELNILKAIQYKTYTEVPHESANYRYYLSNSEREIFITSELKEGHVENHNEKISSMQNIANVAGKYKKKFNDKEITIRFDK